MGLWGSEMPPLRRLERVVLGTHRHRCILLLLFLPIFPVIETYSHGRLIRGIVKLARSSRFVFRVLHPLATTQQVLLTSSRRRSDITEREDREHLYSQRGLWRITKENRPKGRGPV